MHFVGSSFKVIALDVGGLVFMGIFLFCSFKQLNGIEVFMRAICHSTLCSSGGSKLL